MQGVERKLIINVVRECAKRGWKPIAVFDGGQQVPAKTEAKVLEVCGSVDDSTISFTNGKRNMGVLVILGNGIDCISDHNTGDADFEAAMEANYEYWNKLQEQGDYQS